MAQIVLGEQKAFLGDIFGWWYSRGLKDFFIYLKAFLIKITDVFSVKILLRTFLAPWKRDITPLEGLPLNEMLKAIVFNLISRLIGAVIKTFVLFLYILAATFYCFVALFLFFIWIFLPIIVIGGVLLGVILIFSP